MTIWKRMGIVLIVWIIFFCGFELGERLSVPRVRSMVPTVEAVVGRPLTPVSVAGVARRTTRRCAAGVYNC
jgi:hypothetical protein